MRIPVDAMLAGSSLPSQDVAIDDPSMIPYVKKALGERIAALRSRRFDTIEAFARAAGVKPAYAWRIENGRQNLTLVTLCSVSAALGVQLTDIFPGVEVAARRMMSTAVQMEQARSFLSRGDDAGTTAIKDARPAASGLSIERTPRTPPP